MAGPVYRYKCRNTGALMMNNRICEDRPGLANKQHTEWHVKHSANNCIDCIGAIELDPPVPVYPDNHAEAAPKSGMPSAGIAEAGAESAAPAKTKPPKVETGPTGRVRRDSGPVSTILPKVKVPEKEVKTTRRELVKNTARLVEARRRNLQNKFKGGKPSTIKEAAHDLSDLAEILVLLCDR